MPKDIENPLFVAILRQDIDDIVQLIKEGVNVKEPNTNGQTPLDLAINLGLGHVLKAILEHYKEAGLYSSDITKIIHKMIGKSIWGALVPIPREEICAAAHRVHRGMTAIQRAAWAGDAQGIRALLFWGARVDLFRRQHFSPISAAVFKRNEVALAELAGADTSMIVDIRCGHKTGLHIAVENRDLPIIRELIVVHNADFSLVDSDGHSVFDLARQVNFWDTFAGRGRNREGLPVQATHEQVVAELLQSIRETLHIRGERELKSALLCAQNAPQEIANKLEEIIAEAEQIQKKKEVIRHMALENYKKVATLPSMIQGKEAAISFSIDNLVKRIVMISFRDTCARQRVIGELNLMFDCMLMEFCGGDLETRQAMKRPSRFIEETMYELLLSILHDMKNIQDTIRTQRKANFEAELSAFVVGVEPVVLYENMSIIRRLKPEHRGMLEKISRLFRWKKELMTVFELENCIPEIFAPAFEPLKNIGCRLSCGILAQVRDGLVKAEESLEMQCSGRQKELCQAYIEKFSQRLQQTQEAIGEIVKQFSFKKAMEL